ENAREMYKRYADIPQDILEGTRRSNFAPPIRRGSADPVEDLDDDLEGEA
ncbi:DUF1845 family protein, partial [Aeromonas veronii]|nr:DUF1845 family protein [Aeromonas veronii]